jgi:DNA-binding NarL/FixJ family response regulator
MLKDAPPEELLAAIEVVARGDALIAPAVTRSVIEEFVPRSPSPSPPQPELKGRTQRERDVLELRAGALECRDRRTARGQRRHREDACRARAAPMSRN